MWSERNIPSNGNEGRIHPLRPVVVNWLSGIQSSPPIAVWGFAVLHTTESVSYAEVQSSRNPMMEETRVDVKNTNSLTRNHPVFLLRDQQGTSAHPISRFAYRLRAPLRWWRDSIARQVE